MPVQYIPQRNGRLVAPRHEDPATWLSRGEVAKLLGVTNVAVLHLDRKGALHPTRDFRGDARYDPDEVNAYAVSHPRRGGRIFDDGQLAAEASRLFAANTGRRAVVTALRVTYARADELYAEWARGDDFKVVRAARAAERTAERAERARTQKRAALRRALREATRRAPRDTR